MGVYPDEEKKGTNEGIGINGECTPVEVTTESMESEVPTQAPQSAEDDTSGQ